MMKYLPTQQRLILAGDIGGTKTNLAVFAEGEIGTPLAEASFVSAAYAELTTMVAEFLERCGLVAQRAVFGVAGPVLQGRAKVTKLSWVVDAETIRSALRLEEEVVVVNDLVATAHGIFALPDSDLITLNQGVAGKEGPLAVIAPGTGLGEALMFWDGHGYQVQATEGGHALFSPATRRHLALAGFLHQRYGAVSFDFIASGRGLPLVYEFLRQEEGYEEPAWLAEAMSAGDPAPVITRAALDPTGAIPLCQAAVGLLVEIIAVEAANLALKSLCTGGLYIGGGIPPRIASFFQELFVPAFIGQGPLRELLAAIPVHLIMNPRTALLGAARLGMKGGMTTVPLTPKDWP